LGQAESLNIEDILSIKGLAVANVASAMMKRSEDFMVDGVKIDVFTKFETVVCRAESRRKKTV
jgi:hypothetical protein